MAVEVVFIHILLTVSFCDIFMILIHPDKTFRIKKIAGKTIISHIFYTEKLKNPYSKSFLGRTF